MDAKNIFQAKDLQWSFLLVCILNTMLTILKEIYPPLHLVMTEVFSNHWLGQLLLMFFLFVLSALLFRKIKVIKPINFVVFLPVCLIFCVLLLVVFYWFK